MASTAFTPSVCEAIVKWADRVGSTEVSRCGVGRAVCCARAGGKHNTRAAREQLPTAIALASKSSGDATNLQTPVCIINYDELLKELDWLLDALDEDEPMDTKRAMRAVNTAANHIMLAMLEYRRAKANAKRKDGGA